MTDSEILDSIKFVVDGKPVPKARPRTVRHGGRVVTFTPEETMRYEELVRASWRMQTKGKVLTCEAIGVHLDFYMPIPQSLSKKKQKELDGKPHTKRGDIDNLMKSVVDGCNGYVFNDDSQICYVQMSKQYSFKPRVEVEFFDCTEMMELQRLIMQQERYSDADKQGDDLHGANEK